MDWNLLAAGPDRRWFSPRSVTCAVAPPLRASLHDDLERLARRKCLEMSSATRFFHAQKKQQLHNMIADCRRPKESRSEFELAGRNGNPKSRHLSHATRPFLIEPAPGPGVIPENDH